MIFCHFDHVSTRVSWKTSRLAAAPSLFGSSVESSKFTVYPKWIGFRHLQSRFCFNSKLNERQRRSEREREMAGVDIWFTLVLISIIFTWLKGLRSLLSPQCSIQQLWDIKWFYPWCTHTHTLPWPTTCTHTLLFAVVHKHAVTLIVTEILQRQSNGAILLT